MNNNLANSISASIKVKEKILGDIILMDQILKLAERCLYALQNGGKIIFCGNGGSFADAQHLSAELTSRFLFDRPALASIALGTNSSSISAIANDYGYEDVFSRELEALGSVNDVMIAITTSGRSKNILKVLSIADEMKITSYVFTGQTDVTFNDKNFECIKVPSQDTARIQECHILIGHFVCEFIESEMFDNDMEK